MKARMKSDLLQGSKVVKVMVPMTESMAKRLREEAERDLRPLAQICRFAIAEYLERLDYERQEVNKKE